MDDQSTDNLQIKSVVFLTPAKVVIKKEDKEEVIMLSVDLINKKAYTQNGSDHLSEMFFQHLDEANSMPGEFFAPSEEVMEEAIKAQKQKEEILEKAFSGVINE